MQPTCRKKQHKACQHRRNQYFQSQRLWNEAPLSQVAGFVSLAEIKARLKKQG
ncbi:hypothetical protein KJI95_09500 [Shewanella sp. JM162201]|uniref:Transposase n=1 Tax=Shewanella jiangmenensis TaxID=2837387 RepID=A0ABS5V4J3_9GAMM|nr:hypothetical protein [Shewanella jiangmenensis]MBT1444755.1 hypothetical protein [Shewanella jiangmenensis]